jgi:uncharacterized repeat protein (TIGR03803 family)
MNSNCRSGNLSRATVLVLLCAVTAASLLGQTFSTLVNFSGTNGIGPEYGSLVQGLDGNLYGTTSQGGTYGCGAIFAMTTNGVLTTLYSFGVQFECTDGDGPFAGLLQGTMGTYTGQRTTAALLMAGAQSLRSRPKVH